MSIPVLILGESGNGKTFSLRNFKPEEVSVISIYKNRLWFDEKFPAFGMKCVKPPKTLAKDKQSFAQLHSAIYAWVEMAIRTAKTKVVVVDDSQFLMANEFTDRAMEKGYDKFTEIAVNFKHLIDFVNDLGDQDKIVYFLNHSEVVGEKCKIKTIGKMLDEKITVEGLFDIVLYCENYKFYTQANNMSTAKTPFGMFELELDNDLKFVDSRIREFSGLAPLDGGDADAEA